MSPCPLYFQRCVYITKFKIIVLTFQLSLQETALDVVHHSSLQPWYKQRNPQHFMSCLLFFIQRSLTKNQSVIIGNVRNLTGNRLISLEICDECQKLFRKYLFVFTINIDTKYPQSVVKHYSFNLRRFLASVRREGIQQQWRENKTMSCLSLKGGDMVITQQLICWETLTVITV